MVYGGFVCVFFWFLLVINSGEKKGSASYTVRCSLNSICEGSLENIIIGWLVRTLNILCFEEDHIYSIFFV